MAKITATIEPVKKAQATNKKTKQCFVPDKFPTNVRLSAKAPADRVSNDLSSWYACSNPFCKRNSSLEINSRRVWAAFSRDIGWSFTLPICKTLLREPLHRASRLLKFCFPRLDRLLKTWRCETRIVGLSNLNQRFAPSLNPHKITRR